MNKRKEIDMKKIFLYTMFVSSLIFIGCNDKWDDYYKKGADKESVILDQTIAEFLADNEEYSLFSEMLEKTGLDAELIKDQEITIWVVDNAGMQASGVADDDTLRMEYHINNLPFIFSDLKDGLRILSLNGVYFQISENGDDLYVNSSRILKSYRLNNGVVYIIDNLMQSRMNIYTYIERLDDDYSIIRDSILQYSAKLFDKENSIPKGVDKTGNTLYDSVFYVYNNLFEKAKFNSEFEQFTMFLPSNEVITNCFNELNESYTKMGKTLNQADTVLAFKWIREAMFYNGTNLDFNQLDITSSWSRIWRTTVQELDLNNPMEMSNGVIYPMKKVKVPNNVMIASIKKLVQYWQFQEYRWPDRRDNYTFKNAYTDIKEGNDTVWSITTPELDDTPKPSIIPKYIVLQVGGNPESDDEFSVEFPPMEVYMDGLDQKARVLQVPVGEYNFYMGFRSSGHPFVDIYFNDKLIQEEISVVSATPWNFDRNTETEDDPSRLGSLGTARWDGLGGLVGVVNVVGGEGEAMASFRMKVKYNKPEASGKRFQIYHWSLKPTENNY